MNIFALTLTWNNKSKLDALYQSLKDIDNLIWLIRDNDSEDGTEELVHSWNCDFVRYFKYPNNFENFSQGNNYLYEKALRLGVDKEGDYILLLNDDIVFNNTESLNAMISLFADKVAIVGSRLLYPDGRLQHAGVVFVENEKGRFPHNYRSGEADDAVSRMNREFQAVTGACMLVRAKYVQNVLLDNSLSWGFDDVDLCLRQIQRQKRVLYCGEADIIHDESSSLNKNPVNHKNFFKNLAYFNRRWAGKFDVDMSKYQNNTNYKAV